MAAVEVQVAGQKVRLTSSASAEALHVLAQDVDDVLRTLIPKGKAMPPNALVLVALTLANQVREERAKRVAVEAQTRTLLRTALRQVDRALEATP